MAHDYDEPSHIEVGRYAIVRKSGPNGKIYVKLLLGVAPLPRKGEIIRIPGEWLDVKNVEWEMDWDGDKKVLVPFIEVE